MYFHVAKMKGRDGYGGETGGKGRDGGYERQKEEKERDDGVMEE